MSKRVAVVGGGAAGYFFAVHLVKLVPGVKVIIVEKTSKILTKLKVSGGGRCNVTNALNAPNKLAENYPRGKAFLKKVFTKFSSNDTVKWFDHEGVKLKTESDNRIFPETDSSQTVIDCFLSLSQKNGVELKMGAPVEMISKSEKGLLLNGSELFDYVFVASGGSSKIDGYNPLSACGHAIHRPLPSLFTFNIPQNSLKGLEGVAVASVKIKIEKSTLQSEGAFLVTHWGISGPAVLKLSAWGAEELAALNYSFKTYLNFVSAGNSETIREDILKYKELNKNKLVSGHRLFDLPSRLWERLCELSLVEQELKWHEISKLKINKLVENLSNFQLEVKSKTTFKDEFVTCGGVSLDDVNNDTMESLKMPNLYFGGEVLNIDGITGGFNFQAAWSTSWMAAQNVAEKIKIS